MVVVMIMIMMVCYYICYFFSAFINWGFFFYIFSPEGWGGFWSFGFDVFFYL